MKLFEISYMDNCFDSGEYLTVGTNKEQVEKREREKLENDIGWLVTFSVTEISEVDGFKINVA